MNDSFDKMIDVTLEHVGKHAGEAAMYKRLFEQMAYYFIRSAEGDDVMEEGYALMRKHNLVDEDGFWIYDEEDE